MENNTINPNAGQAMGITALVLGILAVITAFIPCFGLIAILFGVLAIIFGAVGMSQAKSGGAATIMPKSGFILGIVATAFVIIWMLVVVGTIGSAVISNKDKIEKIIDSVKVHTDKMNDSIGKDLEKVKDSVDVVKESK